MRHPDDAEWSCTKTLDVTATRTFIQHHNTSCCLVCVGPGKSPLTRPDGAKQYRMLQANFGEFPF